MPELETVNILLVDDEKDHRELGEIALEGKEFSGSQIELETVGDPEEAYNRICEDNYDAVISDYQMGEMNGADLLEKVREYEEEDEYTPFFIHTCRNEDYLDIDPEEYGECILEHRQKDALAGYREVAEKAVDCNKES